MAQIEPDSGIATAMQVGVVHIGYDVAGHHTVNEVCEVSGACLSTSQSTSLIAQLFHIQYPFTKQYNQETYIVLKSSGSPSSAAHQNKRFMQLLIDKQFQS